MEKGEVRVFHHKNEREPALKQLCDLDLGETSAEYGVYTKSIAAGAGFGELIAPEHERFFPSFLCSPLAVKRKLGIPTRWVT